MRGWFEEVRPAEEEENWDFYVSVVASFGACSMLDFDLSRTSSGLRVLSFFVGIAFDLVSSGWLVLARVGSAAFLFLPIWNHQVITEDNKSSLSVWEGTASEVRN
ncbi:unnamed protein product [Hymenolepis diminuta]|uniref:Transmembrane protein n=1 Tax=Hymenolepis diminuta TaxID=6216 RepID=A0A0R3SRH9_HYMDI|nr:unnamed protein product [Hymenolepis diminuta]